MTDLTDLHRVLAEATDHVRSPDLTDRALASASRRRARRTTLGALAVVVLLGGGVAWAVQDRVPRAGVVDTPSPSPAPTVTPTTDTDPATQPVWDPFTVVDAPRYPSRLPEQIIPPTDAPSIADQPLPDIVVAWPEEGADLRVLATNGDWRSVPGTANAIDGSLYDVVKPAISPHGERVAMATDTGILVVEATTGEQQVVPWPSELAGPWDTRPALLWRPDDAGFVVMHWERPWLVDFKGMGRPAPFGETYSGGVMVDPDDGTVRERRWQNNTLLTWEDDEVVDRANTVGYGERFVTRYDRVAYTGSPGQVDRGVAKSGPIVLEAATGEVIAYAPIRDANSVYSDNAHLTALGFLDEVTVLLLVTPMDFRTMRSEDGVTHLVAWDFSTGSFGLIASGGPDMRRAAVAPDLLAD